MPAHRGRQRLPFIGLPDHPKRNQEGSAQLHGIVTTLSRLAQGGGDPRRTGAGCVLEEHGQDTVS